MPNVYDLDLNQIRGERLAFYLESLFDKEDSETFHNIRDSELYNLICKNMDDYDGLLSRRQLGARFAEKDWKVFWDIIDLIENKTKFRINWDDLYHSVEFPIPQEIYREEGSKFVEPVSEFFRSCHGEVIKNPYPKGAPLRQNGPPDLSVLKQNTERYIKTGKKGLGLWDKIKALLGKRIISTRRAATIKSADDNCRVCLIPATETFNNDNGEQAKSVVKMIQEDLPQEYKNQWRVEESCWIIKEKKDGLS